MPDLTPRPPHRSPPHQRSVRLRSFGPRPVASAARAVRRGVLRRRRLLSAVCVGLAVLAGLRAVVPPPVETTQVLVAAHDVPAGTVLTASDLTTAAVPPELVPGGVPDLSDAVGRTTTGPVRRGEPLTDARLMGPSLVAGYPGRTAVPVRISDPGAVGLLRAGDRVDLVATDPGTGAVDQVADDVPVLVIPAPGEDYPGGGRLIVVAVDPANTQAVAAASATRYLSVAMSM